MPASNSLLKPRPACFSIRPWVRMVSGERLVRTNGLRSTLFQSSSRSLSSSSRQLPARPLLPETLSCQRVVEGRVRSWLLVAAVLFAGLHGCGIAAAGQTSAACTVWLREQVSAKSASLVLADIADLSGADEGLTAQLARMPMGSVVDVRLLSRSEVLSRIQSVVPKPGAVLVTGAEATRVTVATRTPEAAELAAILKTHLASVSPWREEEIEIRAIDNLQGILLPQGDVQLRVAGRGMPANLQSALMSVEATLEGKVLRAYWVKADVRVRARVVQVAKPVPYGVALRAEDLREAVCEIEDARADYVRNSGEAVGMTVKRALGPGDLLNRNWLNENRLVRNGETVRCLGQNGGIRVTTLARALQNGKLGDRIRVRNIDSDRTITAVVTGQGEVRVLH
jgi:flagella basal body P-ring formation protein FlgA